MLNTITEIPLQSLVTQRRLDIAVKWRLFARQDEELYRWHIAKRTQSNAAKGVGMDQGKRTLDDYVQSALMLYSSILWHGFDARYPIPVDPDGELLGGAHRLAASLACGLKTVPVQRRPQNAWAPAWDERWFWDAGMPAQDIDALLRDFAALRE